MPILTKLAASVAALALAFSATSCTTTYDAYGRPQQSVDPAMAVAGVAAAGLIGYAIADNNRNDYYHHNRNYKKHNYHGGHHYNRHYRPTVCHY